MQNTIKAIQNAGLDNSVVDDLVHESAALLAVQLEFSTITERIEYLFSERYTERDLIAHVQSKGYALKTLEPGDALSLGAQLRDAGIPSDTLNDLIEETTSMTASSVNNQGLHEQIGYLMNAGMTPTTILTRCGIDPETYSSPPVSSNS